MIKRPSTEILEHIKHNFYYLDGEVYSQTKEYPLGAVTQHKSGPIVKIDVLGRHLRRYHIVLYLMYAHWPTGKVVHINGNTMDDRIENLVEKL
jgi:hypothetical protein